MVVAVVVVGMAGVLLVVEVPGFVVALVLVVVVSVVVIVVLTVGPAQTPQEIRQLFNMYPGFVSQ